MGEVIESSESVAAPMGARLAPEGEKYADTPAQPPGKKARGRSLKAPSGATSLSTNGDVGDGAAAGSLDSITVTRATTKIALDSRDIAEDYEAHRGRRADNGEWVRTCGGSEKCSACLFHELANKAQFSVFRAANALVHALWRLDAVALDKHMMEHNRPPKGKEWPFPSLADEKSDAYHFIRRRAPELPSGSASAVAEAVKQKWSEIRYEALVQGKKSPPHYKMGLPIPVRAQEYARRLCALEDGCYGLSFSLSPGRHEGGAQFKFKIRPRDEHQAALFQMLTGGNVKIGAMQLMQRKKKWFVRISYTRQVPKAKGIQTAAINRGMFCFLTAVTSTREIRQYSGSDIEAGLRAIQARRKRYQSAARFAPGGHGTQRLLRRIRILEAKGERWRATKCQQIARSYVDWLVSRDVSVLYMEDLHGIRDQEPSTKGLSWRHIHDRIQEWPYEQLGSRLKSCAQEMGIAVVERSAEYVSQRCPQCGFVSDSNLDLRRHRMKCRNPVCKYSMDMDAVAAINLLTAGESERLGAEGLSQTARKAESVDIRGESASTETGRAGGVGGGTGSLAKPRTNTRNKKKR